jgi:hypothetical protein
MSTALLARTILGRRFLTVGDLLALIGRLGEVVPDTGARPEPGRALTYIGIERPDACPTGPR